jgi:hypothetical protein
MGAGNAAGAGYPGAAGRRRVSPNSERLQANANGSADVISVRPLPANLDANWVQTVPGRCWLPYFRLYAPTEPYFDRIWPLPDIEKVP